MAKKKILITGTPEYQTGGNIRGTKLSSAQEQKYQIWKNTLPKNLQYEGDYDLRGFYKENPTWTPNTIGQHMTDKYKLPNHPTFSNESMYFSPATKDSAGYWQNNVYIPYNPAVKDTVREYKDGGNIMKKKVKAEYGVKAKNRNNWTDQQHNPNQAQDHDVRNYDPSQYSAIQQDVVDLKNGSLGKLGQMAVSTPNGISPVDGWKGDQTDAYKYAKVIYEHQDAKGNVLSSKDYGTDYESAIAENSNGKWFDDKTTGITPVQPQGIPQNSVINTPPAVAQSTQNTPVAPYQPKSDSLYTDNLNDVSRYGIDSVRQNNMYSIPGDAPVPETDSPVAERSSMPHKPLNFNVNTADIRTATLQGINALLPQQKPKDNLNLYQMAVQTNSNGTGSHTSFKEGGKIYIKPENRGKFNAYKKRTGKTTEEALHSKDPHVRRMAQFAKNASKWKHEDGGMVPVGANGLSVEDGDFTILSPETIKLEGPKHTDGGQMIMYGDQPVEAEGGETIHVSPVDGSAVVGGNLYIPGTNTKYKKGFEKIAKQEKKNNKYQNRISTVMNNITDPKNRYGSPTAGSVQVMNDELQRNKMKTANIKEYLTQMQNTQLDLIDKGMPKDYLKASAKYGKKIAKADNGIVFDPNPESWFKKPKAEFKRNQPGVPDSFPDTGLTKLPISEPQPLAITSTPLKEKTVPKAPLPEAKKEVVKGARNKFRISDYVPEIMAALDKPEPVNSIQVQAITEPEYNLSLQAKKNQILAAYKPAIDAARNSPGQQAAITAQMAEQLASVDSEEMTFNEQNKAGIRARNIQEIRGVRDMNNQLAMQQMDQQQRAKAVVQQNKFNAASSISNKEAQRTAQNLNLQMYENYAGWAYDPSSNKYQMIHPGYQYDRAIVKGYDAEKEADKTRTVRQKKNSKGEWETVETEKEDKAMMGMMMSPMPGMGRGIKKAKKGKSMKYC